MESSQPAPRFMPKIAAETWASLEPFVVEVVDRTLEQVPLNRRALLGSVTALAHWVVRTGLGPLEVDVVLAPATVDRFASEGLRTYSQSSRNTHRSRLRRVSEVLLPDAQTRSYMELGNTRATSPYSRAEVTEFRSWARSQAPSKRRRAAQLLIAVGFGAGLSGTEVNTLRLDNVHVRADGGVAISVTGRNARTVPVLRDWEPLLIEQLAGESSGYAFSRDGRAVAGLNWVSDFMARNPPMVSLTARRMRATWLVTQLTRGVPVQVLLRGAGLASPEALEKLMTFVPTPSDEEIMARLR